MVDNLIRDIYAKLSEAGHLSHLMEALSAALGAESAFMFTSHSLAAPDALLLGHNMSHADVSSFGSTWCHDDVWAHAAAARKLMKRNVVVTGDELVTKQVLHRSRFYNEYAKQAGMDTMLGSVLFDGSERGGDIPFTNLCWYRGAGKPRFEPDDKVLLRSVLPHLQQAVLLHQKLYRLSIQQVLQGAGAADPQFVGIVIDRHARLIASDARGEALLSGTAPLVHAINDRITSLGQRCVPSLDDALRACGATRAPARMLIQRQQGELVRATLTALPADAATVVGAFPEPYFLLVIELPSNADIDMVYRAASLFAFTPSETAVAILLLRGLNVEQIGMERGSSINTVRTQVRGVLTKSGCGRQVDFVRHFSQLMR